jgi:phosphoglycolate phosphatase-like HAD superfamily hydrolase
MAKIIFDLDEVIFDWINDYLHYIDLHWDQLELADSNVDPAIRKATSKDADSWEFFERWGLNRHLFEEVYDQYCNDREFAVCPVLSEDISRDLMWLSEARCEIQFCTSRPLKTIIDTQQALKDNDIHWDKIYHCGGYLSRTNSVMRLDKKNGFLENIEGIAYKKDVFQLEKPDIAIDDKPEYLLEAHNTGVPHCILVSMPHNRIWREKNSPRGAGRRSSMEGITFTSSNKWRSIFYEVLKAKARILKVNA